MQVSFVSVRGCARRTNGGSQCLGERSFVVEDIASWLGRMFGKQVVMYLHGGTLPSFMAKFPNSTGRVLGRPRAPVAPSTFLTRSVSGHGFSAQVILNVIDI
jgi:hypothetical protein